LKGDICFIAQPPLFKVVEKKQEFYLQNEDQMKNYILENGVEKVQLVMGDGSPFPVTGNKLLLLIKKVMRIEDLLDRFEKEGRDRNLIRILAGDPTLTDDSFKSEKSLSSIAKEQALPWAIVFPNLTLNRTRIMAGSK